MSVAPVQSPPLWSLRKIRTASLLLFIASLILSIVRLEDALSLLALLGSGGFFEGVAVLHLKSSPAGVVAELVGLIIGLVAIYAYLRPGAIVMGRADQKYSTASKLINIGYLWGLLLIIIGIPLALIIIGFFLLIAGVILLIIGKIGTIILEFNLYDAEKTFSTW